MFRRIKPTASEIAASLPGDGLVSRADVVMDRAFTLMAAPDVVWPWFVQLGKNRAGWYFPRWVELSFFPSKRGLRHIESKYQKLAVGDVIDDWGSKDATFEVIQLKPAQSLVYTSIRGRVHLTWAIILKPEGNDATRVQLRLRLAPVTHRWLARTGGGFIDAVTVAGLAAGLRERLRN